MLLEKEKSNAKKGKSTWEWPALEQ